MEQRHITGKSHWYHETQSSTAEYDVLPLVPEAAKVSDPFLLDVILDEETLAPFLSWLVPARVLAVELFPDPLTVTRSQTFTAYERLSTALTVAQVCGVQRLCNYYSARLTPLPGPDAPRDKCTLSCAINGIHAAFHYLKKNYISGCVMTVPTGW